MRISNDSHKRECWLNFGRFRVPAFLHSTLLQVQRRFNHPRLRDAAVFLMQEGARRVLSAETPAQGYVQIVTNGDAESAGLPRLEQPLRCLLLLPCSPQEWIEEEVKGGRQAPASAYDVHFTPVERPAIAQRLQADEEQER